MEDTNRVAEAERTSREDVFDEEFIYFADQSDPNGEVHVYTKYRRLEAMFVTLMRAYVRSGIELPILYEGKILDAEQRKGVESGLYEEVAKQLIESVDAWRGEAAANPPDHQ